MISYYAKYYTTDRNRPLLGGVYQSQSCKYSHREDAESYLANVIAVHTTLHTPLVVAGVVKESLRPPEIIRHCVTPQAVGCVCPECGQRVFAGVAQLTPQNDPRSAAWRGVDYDKHSSDLNNNMLTDRKEVK